MPADIYRQPYAFMPGDWVAGKRHGQGFCKFADGIKFRGEWEDDGWVQVHPQLGLLAGVCHQEVMTTRVGKTPVRMPWRQRNVTCQNTRWGLSAMQ